MARRERGFSLTHGTREDAWRSLFRHNSTQRSRRHFFNGDVCVILCYSLADKRDQKTNLLFCSCLTYPKTSTSRSSPLTLWARRDRWSCHDGKLISRTSPVIFELPLGDKQSSLKLRPDEWELLEVVISRCIMQYITIYTGILIYTNILFINSEVYVLTTIG